MKKLIIISIFVFAIIFSSPIIAQSPLPAGTYTIGSGGDFTTISSAFSKLSTDGIAGPVTLELIDTLYSASGAGFSLSGPITGAGSDSRVTIRPAANKNVTVQGNNYAFQFLNISYFTLDGIALTGATTLMVHSLSTTSFSGTINFTLNSDHNIVQNITVINETYKNFSQDGGWEFSDGIAFWRPLSVSSSVSPDSNLIQNNFVKKATVGIYLAVRGEESGLCTGNIIRDNIIGSETDSLISWGIEGERTKNTIVEGNVVQNIRGNLAGNSPAFAAQNILGINLYASTDCIIRNNIVHNIKAGDYPPAGILLTSSSDLTSDNNLVYNNMVYDILCTSNLPGGHSSGIEMLNQDNPKIYYNTIYLSGSGSEVDHDGSADLWITGGCNNVVVKNNIFVNTKDESSSTASVYYSVSNFTSDNNDLFYTQNQNNCLAIKSGKVYSTLPDWQATGQGMLSISEMPNFIAPDLHIDESIPTNIESHGTPIAGIDVDIDGEARGSITTDIGADEFNGAIPAGPLMGIYTVGNGGNFTTISSAFSKLSTDGISGPVTLELIDTLYSASGYSLVGPITGAGPDSRVTIRPADNKNVTIHGSISGLQFLNLSYFTLDGIALTGATTLTVHAPTSDGGTINFILNSDHNIIQNITVINDSYKNFSHPNYFKFSDGIAFWKPPNVSSSVSPDSNLIQNNFIKKATVGIYLAVRDAPTLCTGNIIRDNIIGSETDSLISWGIECEQTKNTIVEGNVVQNIRGNLPGSFDTYADQQKILGINLWTSTDGIIRNNIVHNIKAGDYPPIGILLSRTLAVTSGLTSDNNLVYNNMVYDIQCTSNLSGSHSSGIEMLNQDNPKIYYNTIYLTGSGSEVDHDGSADLWIVAGCNHVIVKNNIFVNTKDESSSTASIYYSISNFTSDNNDLFYTQNQKNCLAIKSGKIYSTLPDWQATGQDMLSISEMPNFIASDLHIDESIPTNIESHGTPIAGVDVDFDGEVRDTVSPDIGADEFDGTSIVGVKDKGTLPLRFALQQNYPNPFNPVTTIEYSVPQSAFVSLKVYDVVGREVARLVNDEKSAGNYEVRWNAENFASGIYLYKISVSALPSQDNQTSSFVQVKKMILMK